MQIILRKLHLAALSILILCACSRDDLDRPKFNEMIVLMCGSPGEGEAIPLDEIRESHLYGYWASCPGYPPRGFDNFSTYDYCRFKDDGTYEIYESPSYHKRRVTPSKTGNYTFEDRNLTLLDINVSVRIIGHRGDQLVYKTSEGNDLPMYRSQCGELYCQKDRDADRPVVSEENCRNWENPKKI